MKEKNMKNKKEIITEEGFALKFYPRETKTVSLKLSSDVVDMLMKKAEERDMTFEALLRFYVSQGLRTDLSPEQAKEFALRRLKTRKGPTESVEIDLAA